MPFFIKNGVLNYWLVVNENKTKVMAYQRWKNKSLFDNVFASFGDPESDLMKVEQTVHHLFIDEPTATDWYFEAILESNQQ